jgi:citrate synthase
VKKGIRFHGLTIPDCQKVLAPAPGGKEIIPESMLWLLLTGEIPSEAQVRALSKEFADNGTLDEKTVKLIDASVLIRCSDP